MATPSNDELAHQVIQLGQQIRTLEQRIQVLQAAGGHGAGQGSGGASTKEWAGFGGQESYDT